jgi:protein TonB
MRRTLGNLETIILGTLLVHVVIITVMDIAGTWARHHPPPVTEEIELDDTPPPEPPPPPKLPEIKPPEPPPPAKNEPAPPPPTHHTVARTETRAPVAREPQPPAPPPETPPEPGPPGGGDEAYKLPEGPTGGIAIPVAHGTQTGTGGRGHGTGGGSGNAIGAGSGPAPVSIAAIKKRAMPRGDYSYFGAGADYPPEARQLGVEGTIRVRLVVDATGKVVSRTLLNKLGHGLDELAMSRAAQIQFDPALDEQDHPVSSVVVWTFDFKLPK